MINKHSSYKDSKVEWIGEIPSSWELVRGKFVFHNKKEINKENQELNLLSLTLNGVLNKDINSNEGLRPTDYSTYQIFEKEDLVFKLIDLENTKTSRVGLVHERGIMSPVYIRLEPQKKIHPKYSYYYYHDLYKQHIYNFLGSGVRSSLTPSNLLEIELPLPPLSEQQQIVSFLDTKTSLIDSLIEKTQRKIELLKEKRTSLINEVVTKGLNPNVEMKDSGVEWIGEIPSHYQMISIKFLVSTPVSDGPHETPQFIDEGGIPFLSVEGVVGNKIDFEKVRGYISEELHEQYSKKCKPLRNDVLLVKSGSTTGKSTIVETDLEFNIWSPLCVIRSNTKKIIPRFTFQTFQSGYFRLLIENNWSYGTQPNIGMGVIENLRIVVPPLMEQQQIVEYLDEQTQKIDKTISIEEKRIKLLKEYRQSLISEVVTGKLKVTTDE